MEYPIDYPTYFLYGQPFLINLVIFIIVLSVGSIIYKKSKNMKKSLIYSTILAITLLILSCIVLLIPAVIGEESYLSSLRTFYCFIPMYMIFLGVLYKIRQTALRFIIGVVLLLIIYSLIYFFY